VQELSGSPMNWELGCVNGGKFRCRNTTAAAWRSEWRRCVSLADVADVYGFEWATAGVCMVRRGEQTMSEMEERGRCARGRVGTA
jgi:hypothetical protein